MAKIKPLSDDAKALGYAFIAALDRRLKEIEKKERRKNAVSTQKL